MMILHFLAEYWLVILIIGIPAVGFLYRFLTKQPFKGDVPPVGVMNDLPESVTGVRKEK